MNENYGFVYLWRDSAKNKYYLGSHWGAEDDGYLCSSTWMNRSYKRRPQDFKRRVLSRVYTTRLDLLDEEQRWMDMIKPEEVMRKYYNMTRKVGASWHSYPEHLKTVGARISAAKMGIKPKWSDPVERGRRISEAKKGKKFSDDHRASLSKAQTGTKQSDATKAKRAESVKKAWVEGRRTGYTHSEETKRKMSAAHLARRNA